MKHVVGPRRKQRLLNHPGCVIAVGLCLLGSPAQADVALVRSAEPVEHQYEGTNFEIDGIRLGMSVDEVQQVLIAKFPSQKIVTTTQVFDLERNGVLVQTAPFISRLSMLYFDVYFGSPTTGSKVVSISRDLEPNQPSKLIEIRAALLALGRVFGPSSAPPTQVDKHGIVISWTFDSARLVSCEVPTCGVASALPLHLDARIDDYELSRGRHVLISAMAETTDDDPEKANSISVTINDIDNRALTEHEAHKQLEAALAALPARKP